MREAARLKVVQAVADRLRVGTVAKRIGVTPRQLERLLIRYTTEHDRELVRDRYSDFGPTLAREKFIERHGITLGLESPS